MNSAICTLFEGDYHFGLGALCNSLYKNGYRGMIYAGHRGPLPPWAAEAAWESGHSELMVAPDFRLRLIPVSSDIHLTYFKADFMLSLWRDHCANADCLFYFDPDITVFCRWSFFEEWVEGGVTVCADVNSDMPASHPIRRAWSRYFGEQGVEIVREQSTYFNAGFVGMTKKNAGFLNTWQHIQQVMKPAVGELQEIGIADRTFPFHMPDQDALNIATMVCAEPISCLGRDGMDFHTGGGGFVMRHATGGVKPWQKKMLWSTVAKAIPPGRADKAFLKYVESPINLYGPLRLSLKKLDMFAASALGRYIR